MSANGLPGNLVDAIRAGMTTIALIQVCLPTYATLRRNDAPMTAGNVAPVLTGGTPGRSARTAAIPFREP